MSGGTDKDGRAIICVDYDKTFDMHTLRHNKTYALLCVKKVWLHTISVCLCFLDHIRRGITFAALSRGLRIGHFRSPFARFSREPDSDGDGNRFGDGDGFGDGNIEHEMIDVFLKCAIVRVRAIFVIDAPWHIRLLLNLARAYVRVKSCECHPHPHPHAPIAIEQIHEWQDVCPSTQRELSRDAGSVRSPEPAAANHGRHPCPISA